MKSYNSDPPNPSRNKVSLPLKLQLLENQDLLTAASDRHDKFHVRHNWSQYLCRLGKVLGIKGATSDWFDSYLAWQILFFPSSINIGWPSASMLEFTSVDGKRQLPWAVTLGNGVKYTPYRNSLGRIIRGGPFPGFHHPVQGHQGWLEKKQVCTSGWPQGLHLLSLARVLEGIRVFAPPVYTRWKRQTSVYPGTLTKVSTILQINLWISASEATFQHSPMFTSFGSWPKRPRRRVHRIVSIVELRNLLPLAVATFFWSVSCGEQTEVESQPSYTSYCSTINSPVGISVSTRPRWPLRVS